MSYDAIIVGTGPNGLAAAITLARAGRKVLALEAKDRVGGGMRSDLSTSPGFVYDICSAIHPLAMASPFFAEAGLENFGLQWIQPNLPLAHPMPDGRATVLERSLPATVEALGKDGRRYQDLIKPFLDRADQLLPQLLAPPRFPRHPLLVARFALKGFPSAKRIAEKYFSSDAMRGMFAGMAAHSVRPLESRLTAAVGLMFCITAHAAGWPLPRGGSHSIAAAMWHLLESLGGEVVTDHEVKALGDLPPARAVLFDLAPGAVSRIAADQLPARYRRKLEKFRHGPGVFKIDWALSGPIPWQNEAVRQAGTVHVGGTWEEIAAAEADVWKGRAPERPFVLFAQQSLFDETRAPSGQHTGWAYCHVPSGCTQDMTERIEAQVERFAPGFRDLILHRHVIPPAKLETYNANYVGGDITGGVMDLRQILARPALRWCPYTTPNKRLFLCSASTPPGGGVHGMCGYHAARRVLRSVLRD
jgi:phytoene dehydrogenase-like protein